MFRYAVRSVLTRKLRLLLTSLAIVMGVGFVSAAFILTDSMRATFDDVFTEATQGIAAVVQTKNYKAATEASQQGESFGLVTPGLARDGMTEADVERARAVPGAQRADGVVFEMGALPVDKNGESLGLPGPPGFAVSWVDDSEEVGGFSIAQGKAPERGEVMLDRATFRKAKLDVGDEVDVVLGGGRTSETFKVSGVVKFGESDNLAGAQFTVFDTSQLQELLGAPGRYSEIDVQADDGVSETTMVDRLRDSFTERHVVTTGSRVAAEQTQGIEDDFLGGFQSVLLAFGSIALFIAAFLVFNTFSMLVAQRTREFGLLGAIGATGGQIVRLVIIEALVVGLIATVLGLGMGYLLALALRGLLDLFGIGLPQGDFALETRTVLAAFAVGVPVTLVASVAPAIRAARMKPIDAMRGPASRGRHSMLRIAIVGVVLMAIGIVALVYVFTADAGLATLGAAFAAIMIGIACIVPVFVGSFAGSVGRLVTFGITGRLARRNLARAPGRSAVTAAALMIGLGLASFAVIFSASLDKTFSEAIDRSVGADILMLNAQALSGGGGGGPSVLPDEVIDKAAGVDGVNSAVGQRLGGFVKDKPFGPQRDVTPVIGMDASDIKTAYKLVFRNGSVDDLDDSGVLVTVETAKEDRLSVGDTVKLGFPDIEGTQELTVRGTFDRIEAFGSDWVITRATFDAGMPEAFEANGLVLVDVKEGTAIGTVKDRIDKAFKDDRPKVLAQDSEDLKDALGDQLAFVLNLVWAMLGLSLLIAVFGIANTVALGVIERTRELGLVRAVGASQRQVRKMVRAEAAVLGLLGSVLGVLLGFSMAATVIWTLRDEQFAFDPAIPMLIGVLLTGMALGIVAALVPAWRAGRMNVLDAISKE